MTTHATRPGARNPWFAPLRTVPEPRATLVCFPYGGGSSAAFRGWSQRLPDGVQLFGVELPGRGARFCEPLHQSLEPLIEALVAQRGFLRAHGAPVVFFGHSLGAMLAFEYACALEPFGQGPDHVVVSGRGAPHLPRREAPIHGLPDAAFIEQVRRFQGLPDEVLAHPELLELVVPILRADFRLSETWRREPIARLRCDLTAIGGREDPMVDAQALGEWQWHARGRFALRTFEGGHFFLEAHAADIVALTLSPITGRRHEAVATQG